MSANPPNREGLFNPTSPHSSSGAADSFKGTPDTRLTAFSPEEGSTKSSNVPQSLGAGARDSRSLRFAANPRSALEFSNAFARPNLNLPSERDPFVSSAVINAHRPQKLSPTASVFLPYHGSFTSGPEADATGQSRDAPTESQGHGRQSVISPRQLVLARSILSTDTHLTRCLVIQGQGRPLRAHDVGSYLSELEASGTEMHGSRQICEDKNGDRIFVRFVNIRDASTAFQDINMKSERGWNARYISPREFAQAVDPGSGLSTVHEGQLYLNIFPISATIGTDPQRLEIVLQRLLQEEGDLFAFKPGPTTGTEGSLYSAIVEYCDNDVSLRAVARFNNTIIERSFQLCIALYRPDIPPYTSPSNSGVMSPAQTSATGSDLAHDLQRLSISRPQSALPAFNNPSNLVSTPVRSPALQMHPAYGMLPILYPGIPMATPPYVFDQLSARSPSATFSSAGYPMISPMTPRSAYIPRDLMIPRPYAGLHRRQNATRIARSPYYQQANSHNHVDVNRIREGTDVRTTIMLRNIPNKVDQAMLKRIVDESSWGKYDFMYLRIDFANDCNVGYAFINFVDLTRVQFVSARGNQRWNCFKSDKVAEISYATIQGKDCLVQKFRNSSVMLEAPHYRPKLYYTLNGPCPELAGEEEAFPGPDNQSKMKRSCENAEHVGLFTPNAGQHFRDEQRRRRSQFDRGTRMAEAEEFDYDAALHHSFYS
ncbi:RNA recognition motif 2-domain-containing protein [Xylariaceae sp. FL0594]|nr:RNA recognition motif 2-domain-containing protein [Xylariaceae sp. FL0594]